MTKAATVTRVPGPFANSDDGFILDESGSALLDELGGEILQETDPAALTGDVTSVVQVIGSVATIERVS
jgi:hypothetical protein